MGALQWLTAHYWYIYGGMGAVLVLVVLVHLIAGRRRANSLSYGSARWATSREIAQGGLLGPRGVMLGRYDRRYLRDDSEAHMLLCGPTRMGKGVGLIIPTLLTWQESVLVTDPKDGENLEVTRGWREHLGPVLAFTPRKAPNTRINVLDAVRLKTPLEFGDAQ
jgi:type IV secretion system protein VirD4